MLKIDLLTLFPNLFEEHLKNLPFRRALEKGLIEVEFHNLRDFAIDSYGSVDDKPYGGGPGMILRPEPVFNAARAVKRQGRKVRIVALSPSGEKFTQRKAQEYSTLSHLILICGRYEGMDQRIKDFLANEVISIGDYVLSGGELAALVVMECTARLIPGVIENPNTLNFESFSDSNFPSQKEYPQYTRPENFEGMKVPEVLLSGDHKEIEKWRKNPIKG